MSSRSNPYLTEYKRVDNGLEFTNVWVNTGFSYKTNSILRFEYNPKPRIVIGDYKLVNVEKDYIRVVDLEENSPILQLSSIFKSDYVPNEKEDPSGSTEAIRSSEDTLRAMLTVAIVIILVFVMVTLVFLVVVCV